jgi:hypothetical protein
MEDLRVRAMTSQAGRTSRREDISHLANQLRRLAEDGHTRLVLNFREVLGGAFADELQEPGPALLDHHLGQQAAHAVADEDHPVEGGVRAIGVQHPPRFIQVEGHS